MHFQKRRRYTNIRPSDAQVAWCRMLGVHVTGDMSGNEVRDLARGAQARLTNTLLQEARIREGSVVEHCSPGGEGIYSGPFVVTRFNQGSTWIRFLEGGKRHSVSTLHFDTNTPTLTYRLVYNASREWTHALSVLPLYHSNKRTDQLRKRTDALHRYIGGRLVSSDHIMMHEVYGEYWATSEVARLKGIFEEDFPEA